MEDLSKLLKDAPSNWGRWGDNDEVGAVNVLQNEKVKAAASMIRSGKVFTLGLPMNSEDGDLCLPARKPIQKFMVSDKSYYTSQRNEPQGGWEFADDMAVMYLQGSTQIDALGHVWYNDKLYNGYDASTTIGGLRKNGINPVAEHGIVGRGVLVDVARHHQVEYLAPDYLVTLEDVEKTLAAQKTELRANDILILRTGFYRKFLDEGQEGYYAGGLREPGMTYGHDVVEWFRRWDIPVFGTDTITNEQPISTHTGTFAPLHPALITRLGVSMLEMLWLEPLAEDCAQDGQYDFMTVISPLKIHGAAGSPINPIAMK